MRLATLAAAGVAALVLASTASAGPYTLSSTALASVKKARGRLMEIWMLPDLATR